MNRVVVGIGNGKITLVAEEDLEVLFSDRDGTYVEVVLADPEDVNSRFDELLGESVGKSNCFLL